jgi:hypothetical protein
MRTNTSSPHKDYCHETARLIPNMVQTRAHREEAMNPTWMDPQSVLDFYQVFLTLLVWMLASLAYVGILASVTLLFLECHPVALGRKHALPTFRDGQGTA